MLSAAKISHGSNPDHDAVAANRAFRNRPADLIWDGTGRGVHVRGEPLRDVRPAGLCH